MAGEEALPRRRRRPRKRSVGAGLLFMVLLLLIVVWTQRVRIATDYIERELERRGVRATYQVTRIGFRTQRLENLVIGDPKRPDATARFVEVKLPLVSAMSPDVQLITARGVRMRGRIVNGKLSLGEVDKLLPPPTGAPFRFPDQNIDVADAAIALDTPAGRLGLSVEGKGNLADGFRGKLAAASSRMLLGDCALAQPRAHTVVAITGRRPSFEGPVAAERLLCEKADIDLLRPRMTADLTVSETMDSWIGDAKIAVPEARLGANLAAGLSGDVSFTGDRRLTRGQMRLAAASGRTPDLAASRLSLGGRYALALKAGRISLAGDGAAENIVAGAALTRPVVGALAGAEGTPLGPIAKALSAAVARAAGGFGATASLRLVNGPGFGALRIDRLGAASRSGADLGLGGGTGLTYYWPAGAARLDGDFALSGGGFPATRLRVDQPRAGGPIRGEARIAPMAAGGARLQLAPVRFAAGGGGATSVDTIAILDGPFGGGRVSGLVVPVSGRLTGGGGFRFGERCTAVGFRALQASGVSLGPTRLPLCPVGPALVWRDPGGGVMAAAEIRGPRLAGRLGDAPFAYAADRLRVSLQEPGFASANVALRLGAGDSVNRLDLASLSGRFSDRGVAGAFAGGAGKLANVPLLLSGAEGKWSLLGGDLAVDGSVTVADEAAEPRFYPLASNDFRLTLKDGAIRAGGWLRDPDTGTQVTEVAIEHSLGAGRGKAVLDVPGITFGDNYQPEELTRLTTGVIALVSGTVRGRGEIGWSPAGVASSGTFSTEKMNLAATFGPVEGLSTTIEFTDLLGLVSAPNQLATADVIRTGIDVFDGHIRYQLLAGQRVRVEAARWPFAGGELLLDETVLDFSKPSPKQLTFRVNGVDALTFVQQMEFTNISATGTFDGIIPMIFDERGGRIVGGRVAARPEGGNLSYIGELTDKQLGYYGKLAFDALKSMRYEKLIINLDGALEGEFLAAIELDGIARDPALSRVGGGISGMVMQRVLNQVAKIPLEFNIRVRGPFRALLATTRSLEDPSLLIQSVLPEILQDMPTTVTVQPEESETVQ